MFSQELSACRVKRADPRCAVFTEQSLDARAHLAGGFIRERHSQNLVSWYVVLGHQVSDAMRDDARLARAGSG
jgi:hypothetical protein